jgi:hypothetical protein
VKKEGGADRKVFATRRQAIEKAREIARDSAPSQMVVYGKDGRIRDHVTHGVPRVQDPPSKSRRAIRLEKAVGRHALERLRSASSASRG